jgi:hypothetical protein
MSEVVEKPVDADAVSNALRLGWQIAELRGRFWQRINAREPVRHQIMALSKEYALPLEDERTPLERLYETQAIVVAVSGQLGLDFPAANLSGQGRDPDQRASTLLMALTKRLNHPEDAGTPSPAARAPVPATAPVLVRAVSSADTVRPAPAAVAESAPNSPAPAVGSGPNFPSPSGGGQDGGAADPSTVWEDFAAFVFAWDARVQDQLAAVSYSQFSAYQLGRGLAEVSWQLNPAVSGADDPHGWQFLLGEQRLRQLGRLMDGLSAYFGPMTVAAVKDSVQAWGTVAREPGITARPDAASKLVEQAHVWRNLLIGGMSAQTLVPGHAQAQKLRGLELVIKAFWPQLLGAILGAVVLAVGAYLLVTADVTTKEIGAALGVLGSLGITSAALIAKSKESVLQVFSRMRLLYYTDLVSAAASRVPITEKDIRTLAKKTNGQRRKKN